MGENEKNLNHDRLFKNLLHLFLDDFLKCFYPDFYKEVNWSKGSRALSESTDFRGLNIKETIPRYVDKLQEVYLVGEEQPTLLHFENQSYWQSEFPRRVYEYNCLIRGNYQKKSVYSFTICFGTYPNKKNQNSYQFNTVPGLEPNTFHFNEVHLKKYLWNDPELSKHPIFWALAPLMSRGDNDTDEEIMVTSIQKLLKEYYNIGTDKARCIILFLDFYFKPDETKVSLVLKRVNELLSEREDEIMSAIAKDFNVVSQARVRTEMLELIINGKFYNGQGIPDDIRQNINRIEDRRIIEDLVVTVSKIDANDLPRLDEEIHKAVLQLTI